MQLLDEAMRTTLTLIANDQLEGIPAQIKKVHPARQLTQKAIEKGVYETPQNPEKIDDFVALDDDFHDDLKGLLKASKTDDLQMATDKFGDLMQGCTDCHTQYRFVK
ncbi:MAG: cytochrome c [Persicimonas sp.]